MGHVIRLRMRAPGVSITGNSFLEMTGAKYPPFWVTDIEKGFAALVPDVRDLFYYDLPDEQAIHGHNGVRGTHSSCSPRTVNWPMQDANICLVGTQSL